MSSLSAHHRLGKSGSVACQCQPIFNQQRLLNLLKDFINPHIFPNKYIFTERAIHIHINSQVFQLRIPDTSTRQFQTEPVVPWSSSLSKLNLDYTRHHHSVLKCQDARRFQVKRFLVAIHYKSMALSLGPHLKLQHSTMFCSTAQRSTEIYQQQVPESTLRHTLRPNW